MFTNLCAIFTLGVTVGFDELAYSVVEDVPEVLACVALTSGCLETTVELMLGTSSNGEAEGKSALANSKCPDFTIHN